MKILVTGANGYIGRFVVKNLLDMNAQVYVADINYDKVDKRAIKTQENIFSNDKDIFKKLNEPDVLIHMAWRDGFIHNSKVHMQDLSSHFNFISNMIDGGLKQLLVMGSMHEVGYHEGQIDENTKCNPTSLYGIAKDALRRATINICEQENVKLQWIRGFYVLGDDFNNSSVFTKILQAEKEGKKEFPFTSGKNKYDFIDVSTLAKQISKTAMQDEVLGIINCCSGKPISLKEQVEKFIKDKNLKIKLKYGAFKDRPYDSPIIYGNSQKIEKIMNLK